MTDSLAMRLASISPTAVLYPSDYEKIAAEARKFIAAEIWAAGRDEIAFLAEDTGYPLGMGRCIGAEDAWKSAFRIARGEIDA